MEDLINKNNVDAKNQVLGDEDTFVLGDVKNCGIKVAVLGNSITRHAKKEEIGWFRTCGMAASDEAHDYVHVLFSMFVSDGRTPCFLVKQASEWECNYRTFGYGSALQDVAAFRPDVLVFRLGENVKCDDSEELERYIIELVRSVTVPETKVVLSTCFWQSATIDKAIRNAGRALNANIAELNDLGRRADMRADGLFAHSGVALHPCDKGMKNIAERIYGAING